MSIGKSRRLVIDVDDIDLKRRLYSALAEDGRSLKDWFVTVATDYVDGRLAGRQLNLPILRAAEEAAPYGESPLTTRRRRAR